MNQENISEQKKLYFKKYYQEHKSKYIEQNERRIKTKVNKVQCGNVLIIKNTRITFGGNIWW